MSTEAQPTERIYNSKEAAAYLRVSIPTIDRWVKAGKLQAYRVNGGQLRFFKEKELLALLEPINPKDYV